LSYNTAKEITAPQALRFRLIDAMIDDPVAEAVRRARQ